MFHVYLRSEQQQQQPMLIFRPNNNNNWCSPSVELISLTVSVVSEYLDIVEHGLDYFFVNPLKFTFNLESIHTYLGVVIKWRHKHNM